MDINNKKPRILYADFFIISLSAAWMIGLGLRMLIEIGINGNSFYVTNNFDIYFDWFLLFLLGVILLCSGVYKTIRFGGIKRYG